MYRVLFRFVFFGFLSVCGQIVQSPCPDYFNYRSDRSGVHGVIVLPSYEPVSSLLTRANFTIAARLPSTYAGNIQPIGSELHLLQDFNRGVPLQYRVNFPVTAPLPKLTSITVNDNIICYGTGDLPGEAQYVTTISLQHMLFFKSGGHGIYNTYRPPQTPAPEIVKVEQPRPSTNYFETNYANQQFPWNQVEDIPVRTPESATPPTTQRIVTGLPTVTPPPPPRQRPQFTFSNTPQNNDPVECGINGHETVPLVFHGKSYERGDWPWLVAIYKQRGSTLSYICVGTLVSDKHVVTAAHCMQRKSSYTSIKNIVVKAGVYNLEDWGDDITVTRNLASAAIHEGYNASTLANDLLVLTLEKSIQLNNFIKPACLWSGSTELNRVVGKSGVVAGWGANEMGPGGKGEPHMARLPIVSTAMCRASKLEFHKLTSPNTLCAGDRKGSGPCLGDSGGGLYVYDNGRWRIRGVVSLSLWSEDGELTCNLEEYVVFTDTAQYLPWINNVMSNSIR